jgi:serpin B
MKTLLSFALASVAASFLVACSSSSGPSPVNPGGHDVAKSSLARDEAPTLTAAETKAIGDGSAALTSDLLGKLRATPEAAGNFAFSPFSIQVALSMPYAGAKGDTATEIAKTMHWTVPQARVAKSYDWATLQLAKRADEGVAAGQKKAAEDPTHETVAPSADNYRLHVVNSLWADKRMVFETPFLDTMATDYGAGVTLADFVANADGERLAINGWVSDETQQKIQNLLPQGSIDTSTRLVLVNALHLKLPWAEEMYAESTTSKFTRADGSQVDATFVRTSEHYAWFEDASVTAVNIPLEGGSVSMVFMIPKSDLASFEAGFTATTLSTIRDGMTFQTVDFSVPKFKFETASLKLKDVLESLGMTKSFQAGVADFSGIGHTDGPLYVGDVIHKAMVGLDEKGVEAAAATAVVMKAGAMPTEPKTVRANKPFFFAIVDQPTNQVLFAGHVADPSK